MTKSPRLTAIALIAVVCSVVVSVPFIGRSVPSLAAPLTGGRVHETFSPANGKIFVLVIGNDARTGNPDESRADAIHIVGIDTATMKGAILNFPRDSWVEVPGYGSGKINETLYHGGPLLLAETLEKLTGIRLDYWIMVGFEGFTEIITELRGVRMKIPTDVYDPTGSGAQIDAGTHNLGRYGALAYVRTRHSFPNGDIDRTTNQGRFLLAMLRKLRRQVNRDPIALLQWIGVTRTHARFDIPVRELYRLAVLTTQVRPADIANVTVPVRIGSVGAASVVFIQPEAASLFDRFGRDAAL